MKRYTISPRSGLFVRGTLCARFSVAGSRAGFLPDISAVASAVRQKFGSSEWLSENRWFVERTVREAELVLKDFRPKRYISLEDRRLRISWLADRLAHAAEGAVDGHAADRFLAGYVSRRELTVSELLVFRSMVSIALLTMLAERHVSEDRAAVMLRSLRDLRFLEDRSLAETHSSVYALLGRDPVFLRMDGASRDWYVLSVERLSLRLGAGEAEVARRAAALAEEAGEHVGRYLTGDRVPEMGESFGRRLRVTAGERVFTALTMGVPAALSLLAGVTAASPALGIPLALLAFLPLWQVWQRILERAYIRRCPPRFVPRLEEPSRRTLVVMPALVSSEGAARAHLDGMLRCALANRGDCFYYAVLADMPDGHLPDSEGEQAIWRSAQKHCTALNEKYFPEGKRLFYLQRSRTAGADGVNRGWERKRGALLELCAMLRGRPCPTVSGGQGLPEDICHVLTVDADTQLPPGSVKKLAGAAEHPMNTPVYDRELGRVTKGYGIIAPGVTADVACIGTRYAEIFGGSIGADSYSTAASEFWNDAFASGTYTGKGIFHVDTYLEALEGRFPEAAVLSHDLLEGSILRTALASDVTLFDSVPRSLISAEKRAHRWTRGDWQLLPFLFGRHRDQAGESVKNAVPFLSRLKMLFNLMRSMVYPACALLMLLGFGTGCAAAIIAAVLPMAAEAVWACLSGTARLASNAGYGARLRDLWEFAGTALAGAGLTVLFLPYPALNSVDAAVRAVYRRFVSHEGLLEWTTAAQSDAGRRGGVGAHYRAMWICPVYALALIGVSLLNIGFLPPAVTLSVLYILAPYAAAFIGEENRQVSPRVSGRDERLLRVTARKTWRFFEELSCPVTGIAPDNVQIKPKRPPAMRCSPTNIAYSLAASLCAADFCYIDPGTAVSRMALTTDTLEALPKWRGHILNWYELPAMQPLEPRFVSTVDNGNLACYLILCARWLEELADRGPHPLPDTQDMARGLLDTLYMCAEQGGSLPEQETLYSQYAVQGGDPAVLLKLAWAPEGEAFAPLAQTIYRWRQWFGGEDGVSGSASSLARRLRALAADMDMSALYDSRRKLFRVGYSLSENAFTESCYDFLASESRHASYFAIAKGDVPAAHWSALSRTLRRVGDRRVLLSWSGTAFEYFMPRLLMPDYPRTLLRETYRAAVAAGEAFAAGRPFGVSESGFFDFDSDMNYQYYAFGVPRLAARTVEYGDYVASPYGACLALFAKPALSRALKVFAVNGGMGKYGFFEALDMNPARVGDRPRYVRSHMAHHQGMILCALENALLGDRLPKLFMSDPAMGGAAQLMKEKAPPRSIVIRETPAGEYHVPGGGGSAEPVRARHGSCKTLKNGSLSFNTLGILARQGKVLLRDVRAVPTEPREGWHREETLFSPGRVTVTDRREGLTFTAEYCVSPTEDLLLCRVTVTNSSHAQTGAAFSFSGVPVLAERRAYEAHPMFSELFIETEINRNTATAVRRDGRTGKGGLCCRLSVVHGGSAELETDRERFAAGDCAGTDGPVIHPILAAAASADIAPKCSVQYIFAVDAAESRRELPPSRRDVRELYECFDWAAYSERALLKSMDMLFSTSLLYDTVIHRLTVPGRVRREHRERIEAARLGRSVLYGLGLSLEEPLIVFLLTAPGIGEIELMRSYLQRSGAEFQCFVLSGLPADYFGDDTLRRLRERGIPCANRRLLEPGVEDTLFAAAAVILDMGRPLSEQLALPEPPEHWERSYFMCRAPERQGLDLWNGFGGFSPDGREYTFAENGAARLGEPMGSVLSNGGIGTLITTLGYSYTWFENSRLFRLTEFRPEIPREHSNEYIMLRESGGRVMYPLPCERSRDEYAVTVAKGRVTFSTEGELSAETTVYVEGRYLKVTELRLSNAGGFRELRLRYVVYPVLGEKPGPETRSIVTELLPCGALTARATIGEGVRGRAFIAIPDFPVRYSGDGANVWAEELNGETGGGLPPAMALEACFCMPAASELTMRVIFGFLPEEDFSEKALMELIEGAGGPAQASASMEEDCAALRVDTGDKAFDRLVNHWLVYQVISSRVVGRTGFFQSGGAYGFRDQLQDVTALLLTRPDMAREHILRCAGRQFPEGDVLHWFHPEYTGVRTRISDDRLFLPWAAIDYAEVTGDRSIFGEQIPYLVSEPIPEGAGDLYKTFRPSQETDTLRGHMERAIDSLGTGAHGLPLIGAGDWNDGMDAVGEKGRGESVWLGFFLYYVTERYDRCFGTNRYAEKRAALTAALESAYRDGQYLRAYYDDGTPLGAEGDGECAIDLLSQVWAVLSGAVDRSRARGAFMKAIARLLRREHGTLLLLDPPFDRGERSPGYIKGYVPGVRENGGQYTHAAAWAVMAAAELGEHELAWELFAMINPINRTSTREKQERYKGEPYAVAADVYNARGSEGRAGWTLYTGSAAIMYRAAVEHILGIKKRGPELSVRPQLPEHPDSVTVTYKGARLTVPKGGEEHIRRC